MYLKKLQDSWYRPVRIHWWLLPLEFLYRGVMQIRAFLYHYKIKRSFALDVPVVVIGNLTVGGTGKTPLVIALCNHFLSMGKQPAVITRGYKSESNQTSRIITEQDNAADVGDEAMLIYQHCHIPVIVGANRVASGCKAIEAFDCDVIICDDGFQHLRLKRDIDVVVVDGQRGFGNGHCLPVGPLREPTTAIKRSQAVVVNGNDLNVDHPNQYTMSLNIQTAVRMNSGDRSMLSQFTSEPVHAIAGIGNPDRFFQQLRHLGLQVIPHQFPDHHRFTETDIAFDDDLPVLMTEKDAVKCRNFELSDKFWSVSVATDIEPDFYHYIESNIFP